MHDQLSFLPVTPDRLDDAMRIIGDGRAFLKAQGSTQWQGAYPTREDIARDIGNGAGFFLTDGENLMAYLCMDLGGDPSYDEIAGAWKTPLSARYMVIHRLAFDARYRGQGLSYAVFDLAIARCRSLGIGSLRIDTDKQNAIMQRALPKSGFTYCGTIKFEGDDKLAYERLA